MEDIIMGKVIWIDALRTIRQTFSKFVALFAIVALGIAFFVGVSSSASIMGQSVDIYNDENKLMDFQVYSNYGFDADDLEALQMVAGIEAVEGVKFVDAIGKQGEWEQVLRVTSFSEEQKINQIALLEGRVPENENECIAEDSVGNADGYQIGDKIQVSFPSEDIEEELTVTEFTVVGLATSPDYLASERGESTLNNRTLGSFLFVPESVFVNDIYGSVLLLADGAAELDGFSGEYFDYLSPTKVALEEVAESQQIVRADDIRAEALEEYEEGYAEYEDGLKEYEDGVKEYEDGILEYEEEIADGEKALADALGEIESGERELDSGLVELQDAQKELDSRIATATRELHEGERQLEVAQAELDQNAQAYEESKPALIQQLAELDAQKASLEATSQGIQDIHNATAEIDGALVQLQAEIDVINASPLSVAEKEAAIAPLRTQQNKLTTECQALSQQYDVIMAALQGQGIAGEAELAVALTEITAAQQQMNAVIENTERQLAEGQAEIDQQRNILAAGRTELETERVSAQSQINSGMEAWRENDGKLAEARVEYEDGVRELEAGRIEGQEELEDAKVELADAKVELDDAKIELEDAKSEIDDLETGEWTVLDRDMHSSSVQYRDTISQMEAIAAVFPIFFFLVAALVCLTTMTRMVDEQRGQMGILRALGYTNFACALKFLFYSAIAAILGGAVGTVVGMMLFPPIIYNTWGLLFELPPLRYEMPVNYIVIANVLFLLLMCGTTFGVAWGQLREEPSQILRPKAPKMGKTVVLEKITFLWKRMSFTSKVTARNLIRYKRRFFMTVIGISGCTALLVSGFGIRESVSNIVTLQYEELSHYDGTVKLEEGLEGTEKQEVYHQVTSLDGMESAVLAAEYAWVIHSEHVSEDYVAQVHVIEDMEAHQQLNVVRERESGEELGLTDGTILISEKLSELLDVQVGDQIGIENSDEVTKTFTIGGIHERYIQHEIFLTQKAYEEAFAETAEPNTIQLILTEDAENMREKLSDIEGTETIYLFETTIDDLTKRIDGINVIVYVIIACAAALAFIVLGNLTNINISERERELATLKVLGFTDKEVNAYMFKENMVLTFFGALLGLLLGTMLHRFIIALVEMEFVMFLRDTTLICFVLATIITFIFSFIVNAIVTRKLKKIHMVESLKSVE